MFSFTDLEKYPFNAYGNQLKILKPRFFTAKNTAKQPVSRSPEAINSIAFHKD
jgi:hypothetical protein